MISNSSISLHYTLNTERKLKDPEPSYGLPPQLLHKLILNKHFFLAVKTPYPQSLLLEMDIKN